VFTVALPAIAFILGFSKWDNLIISLPNTCSVKWPEILAYPRGDTWFSAGYSEAHLALEKEPEVELWLG
jgi:hypothetical protein